MRESTFRRDGFIDWKCCRAEQKDEQSYPTAIHSESIPSCIVMGYARNIPVV